MRYGEDVLAGFDRRKPRRTIPELDAEPGLVIEDADSGFCGAVVECERGAVTLEDRHGRLRHFPLVPAAFLLDGQPVTLRKPATGQPAARRTASGSSNTGWQPAQVAKASRIWVEGVHDAALIERVWGDDLRAAAVVVEPMHGADDLAALVASFRPGPQRRLGVLLDHLIAGSKEQRLAAAIGNNSAVLIAGHPYVDVWQAVKPARLGIAQWPVVPYGQSWKAGVCRQLGAGDPGEFWPRLLGRVRSYHDLETPLVHAVERLIDFVTE